MTGGSRSGWAAVLVGCVLVGGVGALAACDIEPARMPLASGVGVNVVPPGGTGSDAEFRASSAPDRREQTGAPIEVYDSRPRVYPDLPNPP